MKEVWFTFKLVEAILSIICMTIHIQGFMDDREPLPHHMYFCGTFFGFALYSIIGDIGLCTGASPPFFIEATIAGTGSIFFILSSIFSMYYAERDLHLLYLSDIEEDLHPFFAISKAQSISALICGVTYLLHAFLAVDAILINNKNYKAVSKKISSIEREAGSKTSIMDDELARQPIQIRLYCFDVLMKYQFCQRCSTNFLARKSYVPRSKSTSGNSSSIQSQPDRHQELVEKIQREKVESRMQSMISARKTATETIV